MEKIEEAVSILSYANSEEKLEILKECIDNYKKQGFKIILSSGISVPTYIENIVDFLIIDKENPIIKGDELEKIGGVIFYSMRYPEFENHYSIDMNHSYAVLKLMKNAASLATLNNIKKLHIINYDYIIYDENILTKHSISLDNNDLYYYYYTQNENFMNTGIFSVKPKKLLNCFFDINSKEQFCSKNKPVLEELMLYIFNHNGLKIERVLIDNIKTANNKIDLVSTCDYLITKRIDNNDYNLFIYLSKEDSEDNYYLILASNINCDSEIEFEGNKKIVRLSEKPRVFKVDNSMIQKGIKVTVDEYNHIEVIDREKKICSCKIHDRNIVENLFEENKNFYESCLKNGADKVNYHGYHFFYSNLFEEFRYDKFNMLEIGYGDGCSMKTWIDYFPNADINILDINYNFIHSDRCRVIKGDQSIKEDLIKISKTIKNTKLIIDDGSHNPTHQIDTFNYLFKNLLEQGGLYIIEDIEVSYWNSNSSLYGYKSGHVNLLDFFKKYLEMINSEFTKVENDLDISTITFGQNCIIIKKRTEEEKNYFDRNYRFQVCIDDICNFG